MHKPLGQTLYWAPRGAGILFVLFLSIFALDVFGEGAGFWETLAALFIHLIPSLVLALAVAVAWRREWLGAAVFIGWAVFYVLAAPRSFPWSVYLVISGLPAVIGLFFLAGWIWRKDIRAAR